MTFTGKYKLTQPVQLCSWVKGPTVRTGVIYELRPQNGGYFVNHDDGPTYGWMEYEIEARSDQSEQCRRTS